MKFTKEKIYKNFIAFTLVVSLCFSIQFTKVEADEITTTQPPTTEQETTTQVEATTTQPATTINNGEYSISQVTLTLEKGNKKQLEVYNLPKANAKVKWTTSNKFAVKVSSTGEVTAKNYGVATIKATCKKKVVTCVVTVPDTSRSVVLNRKKKTIKEGETYQLKVTSQNPVTFMSRNQAIAIVDETGLVTGLNPGKTTIVAKSTTGYAEVTIKVKSTDVEVKKPGKIAKKKYTRIRRYTKKNKVVYDRIVWAKNKTIRFKLDGIDESKVKKCTWKTEDKTKLTKPVADGSKIVATAKTLGVTGRTKVIARVKFKDKTVKEYSSYVYVTAPKVNTKNLVVLGKWAGENRQQYISFSGLGKYSKIKWSIPNNKHLRLKEYNKKLAVTGLKKGSGTIKASVDGKTIKIKYTVYHIKKGTITSVLPQNKTTKINIKGIDGLTPTYISRNPEVATVATDGTIKGIKSGVTYVDAKVGNIVFSYRVEVAAKGIPKIINRGKYIVNNWKYSQAKRYEDGYYDCSALVWKSYKKYNNYHLLIGGENLAYPSGDLFDFLQSKGQIVYYGYLGMDNLKPGDLIFYGDYDNAVKYSTPGRTLDIYHVSLYAGNGQVVEKDYTELEGQSCKYIVGVGRVVD